MNGNPFAAATCLALVLAIAAGCTAHGPTEPPSAVPVPDPGLTSKSPYGGHAVPLIEVPGSLPSGAAGNLNDTQTGEPGFNNFEVTVNVNGGPPDTDLFFQFVGDILPATRGDGICPDPFPAPPANTIRIMRTSPGGSASAHVKFDVPEGGALGAFDSGEKADFKWRVVNLAQTFDLRTPCVVLTGK